MDGALLRKELPTDKRRQTLHKSLYILENEVLSIKVSVSRPAYFQTFRARNLIKWVRIFVQQYHIYCKLNKLRFHILERKKQIRKRLFLRGNYITRILASFPPFAAGQLFLWTGRGRHASSTIPWWRCWRKRPSCIIHPSRIDIFMIFSSDIFAKSNL